MKNDIKIIKQKINPILKRYKVKRAGLFGSCVRGEMKKGSDIDILIELDKNLSLLDFVGIKIEIEEVLDKKVDLVEYSTIKSLLRQNILKEEVSIL
ncbi:MAG: nucleotidyltransferase family protein [Nanoarchaeota archaeon]|nr:nucleotidyltransferase family protein [Nanoarchaeota archaeon]MCK5629469.1 nucleotidyltransferase family protein [Nanoarchaeota archaeon]